MNGKFKDFRILSGVEVDIRSDGRLDLGDDVLEQLDLVVASIHSGFNQSEAEITGRIEKAIENPHVDIIAHPTGRLIGRREPYPVDMARVMDACKANGTMLEVNAYPERLDLSDGDDVSVMSASGQLGLKARVSDEIVPGVAFAPLNLSTAPLSVLCADRWTPPQVRIVK